MGIGIHIDNEGDARRRPAKKKFSESKVVHRNSVEKATGKPVTVLTETMCLHMNNAKISDKQWKKAFKRTEYPDVAVFKITRNGKAYNERCYNCRKYIKIDLYENHIKECRE